jgi:hypothetical protein
VHVQLDGIRAELERAQDRGERVLGLLARCAAMADQLWGRA